MSERAKENTMAVMSKLMPIATELSIRNVGNWGILFNNHDGIDEAWVVNDFFMIRWTDFGDFYFNREHPLYFEDGTWKDNTLTVGTNSENGTRILAPVELLHDRLEGLLPKSQEEIENIANCVGVPMSEIDPGNCIKIRLPYGNLYNLMWNIKDRARRKRTRIIIKPNPYPSNQVKDNRIVLESSFREGFGMILQLTEEVRNNISGYNKDHFYKIIESEKYNRSTIKDGQMFECELDGFTQINDDNLLDALHAEFAIPKKRLFRGTEIMMHYSKAGFLMMGETLDDVFNTEYYTDDVDMIRVPFMRFDDRNINLDDYNIHPIMLDCDTLFTILEAYRGFRFLDFNISPNEFAPILIEGVRESRDYPTIQTVLTTLGQSVGDIN